MDRFQRRQRFSQEQEGFQHKIARMAKARFLRFAMAALVLLLLLRFLFFNARPVFASILAAQIVPGAAWIASNTGKHVQAHGGAVYSVDDHFYWIGEDKTNGTFFENINCYISKNLLDWDYVGPLLSRQEKGDLGPLRIVERPKVIYNSLTRKWVMYSHIDDEKYKEAKVGVAEGSQICGPYTYHGSFRPLDQESRDIGLFQDADGSGYLLTEDRRNGLRIDKLSSDFLSVQTNVYTWKETIESPALIIHDGVYFMFGSHLTGWKTNDNVYSTAMSLEGPWSEWQTFAESGSETYHSQTSFVLPLGKVSIYMGDRWDPDNLMRSSYIWLPLEIQGKTAMMRDRRNWILDLQGNWAEGTAGKVYQAEDAELFGHAKLMSCRNCSSGSAVTGMDASDSGLAISHYAPRGPRPATLLIYSANADETQRYGNVRVNDGTSKKVAFLPGCANVCHYYDLPVTAVNIDLQAGVNDIKVVGAAGPGPDVDKLEILVA